MTDSGVRLDRDGPVVTLTLCRPHVLNAQTPAMWGQLRRIGRDLPGDVRVVVVRGEGRAFSAGLDLSAVSQPADSGSARPESVRKSGDGESTDPHSRDARVNPAAVSDMTDVDHAIKQSHDTDSHVDSADSNAANAEENFRFATLAQLSTAAAADLISTFQAGFDWLRRPDLITIAAVQGYAIGAGFQLALACDLRVLADNAQFAMAEVSLGLVPDLGGTKRLVELVGYGRALELCVTGRRIGAAEADRMGLVTSVVPLIDLDKVVRDLTAQIIAAPRDAVVEIKALLAAAAGRSFAEQEKAEREAQVRRIRDLVGLGE